MELKLLSFPILISLFSITLTTIVLVRSILLRKQNKRLGREIANLNQELITTSEELQEIRQKYIVNETFKKDLNEAELTTRLQKPRLSIVNGNDNSTAPERYQYIHSLTQKGMNAKEIASILSISDHEAEQLVKLAQLATTSPEK